MGGQWVRRKRRAMLSPPLLSFSHKHQLFFWPSDFLTWIRRRCDKPTSPQRGSEWFTGVDTWFTAFFCPHYSHLLPSTFDFYFNLPKHIKQSVSLCLSFVLSRSLPPFLSPSLSLHQSHLSNLIQDWRCCGGLPPSSATETTVAAF